MRQYYLITLLIIFSFLSCEKEDSGFDSSRLTQLSQATRIDEVWIDLNYAHWELGLSEYSYHEGLKEYVIVSWRETGKQTAWQEMRFDIPKMMTSHTQKENIVINNLSANTSYSTKWEACDDRGNRVEIKTMDFSTKAFTINYKKTYPSASSIYYNGLITPFSTLSLEDGTNTLYGNGFNNIPLTVNFVSVDNSSDHFEIQPVILNDSVLKFKVPANILPNDPYVLKKKYNVTVNQTVILNQRAYDQIVLNRDYTGAYQNPGTFTVFNKDFIIELVQIKKGANAFQLDTYTFIGRLGPIDPLSMEYVLGIPLNPLGYKKMVIKSGSAILKTLDIKEKENVFMTGNESQEYEYYFMNVQSCRGYSFKLKLEKGNYTVQFVCETSDAKQVVSNEFAFKVE